MRRRRAAQGQLRVAQTKGDPVRVAPLQVDPGEGPVRAHGKGVSEVAMILSCGKGPQRLAGGHSRRRRRMAAECRPSCEGPPPRRAIAIVAADSPKHPDLARRRIRARGEGIAQVGVGPDQDLTSSVLTAARRPHAVRPRHPNGVFDDPAWIAGGRRCEPRGVIWQAERDRSASDAGRGAVGASPPGAFGSCARGCAACPRRLRPRTPRIVRLYALRNAHARRRPPGVLLARRGGPGARRHREGRTVVPRRVRSSVRPVRPCRSGRRSYDTALGDGLAGEGRDGSLPGETIEIERSVARRGSRHRGASPDQSQCAHASPKARRR